jgi:hypothetical protein
LSNGVPVTGLSGAAGSKRYFVISSVPAGYKIKVSISGGTGAVVLYLRGGVLPTLTSYDCRSSPICQDSYPAATSYYVMLIGNTAYSGLTLQATL